jgi:16S rRNA C967 or C1407 C5-methylase (RsmB/RsmF family)
MTSPSNLLIKLSRKLFAEPDQQAAFIQALTQPPMMAPAIVWTGAAADHSPFRVEPPLPWQPACIDRLAPGSQPGRHPLHAAGAYYCLDTSSVFAATVLAAVPRPVARVVDLCAAPGGKSILAQQLLQPEQLFCNEVIRKRVKILIANLKRCRLGNATVFNLDPAVLAQRLPGIADVVLVDAPCSGQSLLAKGQKADGCFHPVTLKKNAQRQKRILSHGATLVASGGYLAYMTCTYAPEENEQVIQWLLKKFPEFQPVRVEPLAAHQSPLTELPCYRLWPQHGVGAGAFTVLLQKGEAVAESIAVDLTAFIDDFGFKLFWE